MTSLGSASSLARHQQEIRAPQHRHSASVISAWCRLGQWLRKHLEGFTGQWSRQSWGGSLEVGACRQITGPRSFGGPSRSPTVSLGLQSFVPELGDSALAGKMAEAEVARGNQTILIY